MFLSNAKLSPLLLFYAPQPIFVLLSPAPPPFCADAAVLDTCGDQGRQERMETRPLSKNQTSVYTSLKTA